MQRLANTGEAIAATTKKLVKVAIVAEYLKSRTVQEAAVSAVFLSGRPFPAWEETTLQIGGRWLWRIVAELAGQPEHELSAAYRRHGDLGAVAKEVLPERPDQGLNVLEVEGIFRRVAATRGPSEKAAIVGDLLGRATPGEAKLLVKIMTGDLRIGLKESLVEEAIAKAYGAEVAAVQRANLLLGDVGEALRLAAEGALGQARVRLFHPLGFMLASPVETPEEGLSYFSGAAVEDKYDGIRAQAHISGDQVKIFSRTRDEITESFPELPPALAALPEEAILDGEIVAWTYPSRPAPPLAGETASEDGDARARNLGSARPFSVLQPRLGRKTVHEQMLRSNPVAFLVFDILYANGELLIDQPLQQRAHRLDELLAAPRTAGRTGTPAAAQASLAFDAPGEESRAEAAILRAPVLRAATPAELEALFVAARARGNEGLMIKDLASPYTPGKRGKCWLKMKRELATLDVVVTAVEYGHGKRIGVLSDYTFAVWEGDALVNIGKAYSGLTDAEIAEMTRWFLAHTTQDQGARLIVEPTVVLEVAFNNIMRSDRHASGYALRFPRIVRLRTDKTAEDADTLERARQIYERQQG